MARQLPVGQAVTQNWAVLITHCGSEASFQPFSIMKILFAEVISAPANLEASVTVTQNKSLSETHQSDKELEQPIVHHPKNSTSSSTATTTLTSSQVNQSKSCHAGYCSIRYYGSNFISG